MSEPPYVPLRPIPIKERSSIVFLQYGELDVIDTAFVLVDANGIRITQTVLALKSLPFPAHAGLNRRSALRRRASSPVPHTRGAEPLGRPTSSNATSRSPRTRG